LGFIPPKREEEEVFIPKRWMCVKVCVYGWRVKKRPDPDICGSVEKSPRGSPSFLSGSQASVRETEKFGRAYIVATGKSMATVDSWVDATALGQHSTGLPNERLSLSRF